MAYAIRVGPEMVGVRIYRRATDMEHILQAQACRGTNREVDLDKIGEQLLLKGNCHVSDSHSYINDTVFDTYLATLAY